MLTYVTTSPVYNTILILLDYYIAGSSGECAPLKKIMHPLEKVTPPAKFCTPPPENI